MIKLMKYMLFAYLIIAAQDNPISSLQKYEWLLGTWERQNVREGASAFEVWNKVDETTFVGKGIAMKGADTTFVENLKLIINDNSTYFIAEVSHNAEATYFKVTSISDNEFVCENPEHDFPKKIKYSLDSSGVLTATISGNAKEIPFVFKKAN